MTQAHKTIEKEFRKYPNNENAEWKSVCDKTLERFKWTQNEKLIRKYYFDGKSPIEVYMELYMSEREFYYSKREILDMAFRWAREYKLL